MKEKVYDELVRLSLKGEFTADDLLRVETALAAHPEMREDWESDVALGRILASLRDTTPPSNFTARVLDAIDLNERAADRNAERPRPSWLHWFQPRLSTALVLVLIGTFGIYEYRTHQRSLQAQRVLARDVGNEFAALPSSLPAPEIFTDFDAIESMSQISAVSDDELLTVLQK